jgi:TM2 domain-containing membrane protein YozV
MGPISPKSRNTVILLCFFLGGLGIHRFYLGKIVTGIFMILTLGGLGIWTLVDLFISIFGTYTDSDGRYVDRNYNKGMAVALIVIFVMLPVVLGIVAAIALPQYAKHRMRAWDNATESAYHNISLAEEAFFARYSVYTSDYDDLILEGALTIDPNIDYGNITVKVNPSTGQPGFSFTLKNKRNPGTEYFYDSTSSTIVTKRRN